MMEKVFKVKYGTRNGEREKHNKIQSSSSSSWVVSALETCRDGAGQSLAPRAGCGGTAGESRGRMCWAPPASQEGRGMAKGTLGVRCPPPAFCTVCGSFVPFLPFQAVPVQPTARLWENQFGKELRSLSTLQFNSEREISLESV